MIFFYRWLNKYTIHWQSMIIHELWNLIIFLIFKTSLVLTPPYVITRIAYENRYVTHPLPIFNSNSYLFYRVKIVPIYAHESYKPITLIKRRIEYLTRTLLAQFSKIIMFFQFLLEKVSRRFDNDLIHEIEYSWSVNIDKTAYSSSLLRVIIAYIHLPFFKIFSHFVAFWANFQIFSPFFEESHPCSYFLQQTLQRETCNYH